MPTYFPVILPVPDAEAVLRGPDKVRALGRLARTAVRRSAEKSGLPAPAFRKGPDGAPLPDGGVHWSLSHKDRYVAGIAATAPVGIDVESVRERREALFRKIADAGEWARLGAPVDPLDAFHRCWTAKEAVLKAAGVGLARLSRCRVLSAPAHAPAVLGLDGELWVVVHHRFDRHVAALAAKGAVEVAWEEGAVTEGA